MKKSTKVILLSLGIVITWLLGGISYTVKLVYPLNTILFIVGIIGIFACIIGLIIQMKT